MSAIGIRNALRATYGVDKVGDISIFADISKVIANPSDDPFYKSNVHAVIGADWTRPIIDQYLNVGGRVTYDATGKMPYHFFEEKGRITPENERAAGLQGMVWIHGKF